MAKKKVTAKLAESQKDEKEYLDISMSLEDFKEFIKDNRKFTAQDMLLIIKAVNQVAKEDFDVEFAKDFQKTFIDWNNRLEIMSSQIKDILHLLEMKI